ncbi:MAG: TetR-like C-terminal domain-containing protein, partial [Pseudomonadota bacterium]
AARAGVSHAAPRNHFASRKALLTALATEGYRRHAAAMRAGTTEASTRKERLRAAFDGYVAFARAHPHLYELMFRGGALDREDAELGEAAGASYAVLIEIAEGLDWPRIDASTGDVGSEIMLWSLAHGYAHLAIHGQLEKPAGRLGRLPSPSATMPDFDYET